MTFFSQLAAWAVGPSDTAIKKPEPTLRGTVPHFGIVDETEPKVKYVPNRKQKRDYAHSLRTRTRNTKFSQRSKSRRGKGLHADANNKVLQFILNVWLQVLWTNARIWNTEKLA